MNGNDTPWGYYHLEPGEHTVEIIFNEKFVDEGYLMFLFYGMEHLTSVDLSKFDLSKVNSVDHVFTNCTSLKEITISGDISNLDWSSSFNNIRETGVLYYDSSNIDTLVSSLPQARSYLPLESQKDRRLIVLNFMPTDSSQLNIITSHDSKKRPLRGLFFV